VSQRKAEESSIYLLRSRSAILSTLDDCLAGGLSGRSDRTRELYRETIKPLREPLGDTRLRELTAGDVQQTLDALADRLSTRTLQILGTAGVAAHVSPAQLRRGTP
jgi:hypothetical protein